MINFYTDNLREKLQDVFSECGLSVTVATQSYVKSNMKEYADKFPMIFFEHTNDSNIEVLPEESKFLNDDDYNGMWLIGKSEDFDEMVFMLCIDDVDHELEISALEINSENRRNGYGQALVNCIINSAYGFYNKIWLSPFDTDAMNFWSAMEFDRNNTNFNYEMNLF